MLIVSRQTCVSVDRSTRVPVKREAILWILSLKRRLEDRYSAYGRSPYAVIRTCIIFDKRRGLWQGQVEVWTRVVRMEKES